MLLTLQEMTQNQSGIIKAINGGYRLQEKLNALGIRETIKIKKLSNALLGGPVTIRIDSMEIAIGKRMAEKIIVEV